MYTYKSQKTVLSYFIASLHSTRQGSSLDPPGAYNISPSDPRLHLTWLRKVESPTIFHYYFPKSIKPVSRAAASEASMRSLQFCSWGKNKWSKNEESDSQAIHLYVVTCLYNYGQQTNFTYYGTLTSQMHTKKARKH